MIRLIINLYFFIILADTILSYLPHYRNEPYGKFIKQMADYSLNPVRKILPSDAPFDFSPVIVMLILQILPVLW